jgi:hypothetical protein
MRALRGDLDWIVNEGPRERERAPPLRDGERFRVWTVQRHLNCEPVGFAAPAEAGLTRIQRFVARNMTGGERAAAIRRLRLGDQRPRDRPRRGDEACSTTCAAGRGRP